MKKYVRYMILCAALFVCVCGIPSMSYAAQDSEYICDTKVISGDSEEDVTARLRAEGYTPILVNIAQERPELKADFVYLGYKTTTEPQESIEGKNPDNIGSVFGDMALMMGGFGIVLGVLIGMVSMRIRPRINKSSRRDDI